MEIELRLTKEEVDAILSILGQLQNSTNTYPLAIKINEQVKEQVETDA